MKSCSDCPTTDIRKRHQETRRIADAAISSEGFEHRLTRTLDAVLLHRLLGPIILLGILFLVFQAVFSWAEAPMEWIDSSITALQTMATVYLPEGLLRSMIADGIIAGVGAIVIFLPQILLLFTFIMVLESSGYMPRAAFLMDRLMSSVGLNGRAFIPLLSSFACTIPGIMAARVIDSPRDRLTTILIAPLMACSARLPVYTLIIAAFIPNAAVWGGIRLQGLVMFGLYVAGIIGAVIMAAVFKKTLAKGPRQPLIMELPKYQPPSLRDLGIGLLGRSKIFLVRAGTIILACMILLWGFSSFPGPPEGATDPAITYSIAGILGRWLLVVLEPVGFNWEIAVALIPGMAAREVVVGALGTVYSLSGSEDAMAEGLVAALRNAWSLPTALSFLAWYVFAPQCFSTLAVARRETNSLFWPFFMFAYLTAMAYVASFATYHIASTVLF